MSPLYSSDSFDASRFAAEVVPRTPLSGWGRYPIVECAVHQPSNDGDLERLISGGPVIARGAGRAYGDSALQSRCTIVTKMLGNSIKFDPLSGVLECDSGVSFATIIGHTLRAGWFPPVTPGTQHVTIGGAIAADVHGKNHHIVGSFGDHVLWFDLMCADGMTRRCSNDSHAELFRATIGGMGLTGLIRRAAIKLIPIETGWVRQEIVVAVDLPSVLNAFEKSRNWTYSVAWIDALSGGTSVGRSILIRGEHARLDDLSNSQRFDPFGVSKKFVATVPLVMPSGLLNRWSARVFNSAYWTRANSRAGASLVDYQSFFYPLDTLNNWNRLYGRPGFLQYQCVLPIDASLNGLRLLLDRIRSASSGAFLAVLKLLGEGRGGMSFPMKGYTLALDFPNTRSLSALFAALDRIVLDHGGRLYLAKDARMSAETFQQSYKSVHMFESIRSRHGAAGVFRSHQSERLGIS